MKQLLTLAALMLAVPIFIQSAEAATIIRVSQESKPGVGDFESNPLGFIEAFSTPKTTAAYYAYNAGFNLSFNGSIPPLTAEQSHLFFVNTADGLSLFIVNDKPGNADGGFARMRFVLSGDTASLKLVDDPDEATENNNGTIFTGHSGWAPCCTDGLAIGSLDDNWEMSVQFTALPQGINSWVAYSASTMSTLPLVIQRGRRVQFKPVVVPVPEPSFVIPLTLAGLGLTQLRRRTPGGFI